MCVLERGWEWHDIAGKLPSRALGKGAVRGGRGLSFFHSHFAGLSSQRSAEYLPYSTIPPKTRILAPSVAKPKAAQPVGTSPLTNGWNHWLVAQLKTFKSSTMPSLPPPKIMIKSLTATARWPCRGLGLWPMVASSRFHWNVVVIALTSMAVIDERRRGKE